MKLPFFYIANANATDDLLVLDEDTSKHVVGVLRMKRGEALHITDGKGNLFTATIADDHKKRCAVKITDTQLIVPPQRKVIIGISVLKNTNRFEWFLEKATEIGITAIIPLVCERTEKEKFRRDRMLHILTSAMLQSQQCWLPVLHEPIGYELLFAQEEVVNTAQKFIAHCIETDKKDLLNITDKAAASQIILIGPEGDFTPAEVDMALQQNFVPVSLGDTRLRAETAAMTAAVLLRIGI
jgi:16S rRNA (uracil1498-N3)-methyltransferase